MTRADYMREYRQKKRTGVPTAHGASDAAEVIIALKQQVADLEAEIRHLKHLLSERSKIPTIRPTDIREEATSEPVDITELFDLPEPSFGHSFGAPSPAPKPGAKPKPARR